MSRFPASRWTLALAWFALFFSFPVLAQTAPKVSVQAGHTLALGADGRVVAWGGDAYGQLGTGRTLYQSSPTRVGGLPTITQASAGAVHVAALDGNGDVWTWGDNVQGALGPRDEAVSSVPGKVTGVKQITQVMAGENFTAAVRRDGQVLFWGTIGSTYAQAEPILVPGANGLVQVATGSGHLLALRGDGRVFSMGFNTYGQLGDGKVDRITWGIVPDFGKVTQVSASSALSLALTDTGQVWMWGNQTDGPARLQPTQVTGFSGRVREVVAAHESLAVLEDGSLWTWDAALQPRRLDGFTNIRRAASTLAYFGLTQFGLDAEGRLFASGNNSQGLLGIGSTVRTPGVVLVPEHRFIQVAGINSNQGGYVLGLKSDGGLFYWGENLTGVGGETTLLNRSVPVRETAGLTDIVDISAGGTTSFALDREGRVFGWGDGLQGQLGDGTRLRQSKPTRVPGLPAIRQVAAGVSHALLLDRDGRVWQTGGVGGLSTTTAVLVPGLTDIVKVSSGCYNALALDRNGRVFEWGEYYEFTASGPQYRNREAPTLVAINETATDIAAGCQHHLVITQNRRLWSWGNNGNGQLGDGTRESRLTPRPIPGTADFTQIAAGYDFSMALQRDGRVATWGYSEFLGNGSIESSSVPVLTRNFGVVQSIAAGFNTAHAITTDGLVWAWGQSFASPFRSSLGDGGYTTRLTPVIVRTVDGGGTLDAADWALDLDPTVANTITPEYRPNLLTSSRFFGGTQNANLVAQITYRESERGRTVGNYVFGFVPRDFLAQATSAGMAPSESKRSHAKLAQGRAAVARVQADSDLVLVQLTATGWQVVTGQLTALTSNVVQGSSSAQRVLNNVNLNLIPGAQFCVGYGTDANAMLNDGTLAQVLTLPGASATSGGLPCLRSGVYLEGADQSTTGSTTSFNATVIGIAPTGRVALTVDGSTAIEAALASTSNAAVAGATFLLDSLGTGRRSIRASYGGAGQNPAAVSGVLNHTRSVATITTLALAQTQTGANVSVQVRAGATPAVGDVIVKVDGVEVTRGPLTSGNTNLSIPAASAGAHTLVADFLPASSDFAASRSAPLAYTLGTSAGVPLAFATRSGVASNTLVTSSAVAIRGIGAPAVVTVSGAEYSLGCGDEFTAAPGVIVEGQSICLRLLSAGGPGQSKTATVTIGGVNSTFTVTTAATVPSSYQDMWWTPGESGHGIAILQHGQNLFAAWYLYDSNGQPDWVVLPTGSWNASLTEYSGAVYRPTGSLFSQYNESRFRANASVGTATLRFTASDAGSLSYTIDGRTGVKPIARFPFGATGGTSPRGVGDLWWGGPGNNGWGVSIAQQFGGLFVAWYTYDVTGRPQWFVAPSGNWLGSGAGHDWTADVYRVTGSPVLGANYDANRAVASKVGTLSLKFSDDNRASLIYDVAGQRGRYELTRLVF